ncbi:hypothetical protein E2562_004015 [Oryza meyeriana var. granulata]|uniref:Uncharacterized protein n=1 Tax=Oryza meyeriana var. granulata TaxID=110450 RepID=A0A6G1BIX2_9ORYZ|nr:hypothetical protein E2562_004015 [Oryza meyeriana var. granulata]
MLENPQPLSHGLRCPQMGTDFFMRWKDCSMNVFRLPVLGVVQPPLVDPVDENVDAHSVDADVDNG